MGTTIPKMGRASDYATRAQSETMAKRLIFFDVGANRGDYTDLIGSCFEGIDFEIHSFEPSRVGYGSVQGAFVNNSRIILNNFGLGNESGDSEFIRIPKEAEWRH